MSSRFQFPSFQESLILRRLFFSNGRLSITLVMSLVIFTLQNAAPYPCSLILKINNQNLSQWLFLWYFSRIKLIGSLSAASLEGAQIPARKREKHKKEVFEKIASSFKARSKLKVSLGQCRRRLLTTIKKVEILNVHGSTMKRWRNALEATQVSTLCTHWNLPPLLAPLIISAPALMMRIRVSQLKRRHLLLNALVKNEKADPQRQRCSIFSKITSNTEKRQKIIKWEFYRKLMRTRKLFGQVFLKSWKLLKSSVNSLHIIQACPFIT